MGRYISHARKNLAEKWIWCYKKFEGHGIGREMHEEPGIPNYGKQGRGIRLEPGMTLAIEPMVVAAGNAEFVKEEKDGYVNIYIGWRLISTLWKYNFNYRKRARNIAITLELLYNIIAIVKIKMSFVTEKGSNLACNICKYSILRRKNTYV